jgi:hypothetical protein
LLHIVFILVALSVARSIFTMVTASAHPPAGGLARAQQPLLLRWERRGAALTLTRSSHHCFTLRYLPVRLGEVQVWIALCPRF